MNGMVDSGTHLQEDHEVAGDAQQAQADDEQPGDRAAAKATLSAGFTPWLAASAVRTLARTETYMPM